MNPVPGVGRQQGPAGDAADGDHGQCPVPHQHQQAHAAGDQRGARLGKQHQAEQRQAQQGIDRAVVAAAFAEGVIHAQHQEDSVGAGGLVLVVHHPQWFQARGGERVDGVPGDDGHQGRAGGQPGGAVGKAVHQLPLLHPQVAADQAERQYADGVADGLQRRPGGEVRAPQQGAEHVAAVAQQQACQQVVAVKAGDFTPQQQHGGQHQEVVDAAVARRHGQQEVAGCEYGVKVRHSSVHEELAGCPEFHKFQILARVDRKPLKIPHNLENGPIILYPSPLLTPRFRGQR